MATVRKWSGRETRALREALRQTVRAFAAYLGVNERTITKWEAGGERAHPRPEMQAALDTALSRATADEQERFESALRGDTALTDEEASESPRRAFPARDDFTDELRERLTSAAAVDDRALTLLAAQADHVRELDRMLGARAAESQLRGYLATLDGLRRFATLGRQREALADLYADAAALAGWQALDLGEVTTSWHHHEAAKDAGREGQSPAALVHAMAQQAYILVEVGELDHAVQLAEYARSLAEHAVPPLLLAWLWAVEGEVHASAGNGSSCHRAFDAADRHRPSDCHDPALPYIMLDGVHLARWRGHAWARLGDPGAIEDLRTALSGLDATFTRAKAGLHVDLAHALVAAKQPNQATEHLREAEVLAARVGSTRQRRRARRLQAALRAA